MTILTLRAKEEGLYVITAAFFDEDDAAVTPNNDITWTLTDDRNNIINARDAVSIAQASSVVIVLKGDDLALINRSVKGRVVTVKATYDSVSLGSGLPIHDQCSFVIEEHIAIP